MSLTQPVPALTAVSPVVLQLHPAWHPYSPNTHTASQGAALLAPLELRIYLFWCEITARPVLIISQLPFEIKLS